MKDHINLSLPCLETATMGRQRVSINRKGKVGSITLARLICLSYLHLPLDHKGGSVCHACNNDKCVNPQHLYLGTQSTNLKDAVLAGTHFNGFKGASRKQNVIKCCSPNGTTIIKIGYRRASEATGIPLASIHRAVKCQKGVRGWKFEALKTILF
jgi:hypothetical protein